MTYNITTNGNLGYRKCNTVECKTLLNTLKTGNRTKDLLSAGSYLRTACWKHKNSLSSAKGKEEGRTRDHPGFSMSFWA